MYILLFLIPVDTYCVFVFYDKDMSAEMFMALMFLLDLFAYIVGEETDCYAYDEDGPEDV